MNSNNKFHKIVKWDLGKIAYNNPKYKSNMATISFGFRYLSGNDESYFTVTGEIWNRIHTDILTAGAGVQDKIKKYFPHNETLARICELAEPYHLRFFSKIGDNVKNEIMELMEKVEKNSEK